MKTIGLFTAWACEDWIEYSIDQALQLVDELIISIGAFSPYFKGIEDRTFEKAQKYLKNEKVKFIPAICDPKKNVDGNKCSTLNKMLEVSQNIEKNNVIWILDSDEFYSKESLEEIYNFLNSNEDFDVIYLRNRYFCINFNYYFEASNIRLFKIKTKNCYFTPTQHFHPIGKKEVELLETNPMFHYSFLTGEPLKMIYWLSSEFYDKITWYFKIYKKFDKLHEDFWMKKNEEITGKYRFFLNDDSCIEKNGHGLFTFQGVHPEIIENSPLKKISDFRVYMKKKPNYKNYLIIMKELIVKKKKFNIKKKLVQINYYFSISNIRERVIRFFRDYFH